MKNIFLLAIFLLFISCKNEPNPESSNIVEKKEISHSLKTDTIFFNYSKKSLKDGYVVINFISKENKKDSISISRYNLCFFTNQNNIFNYELMIEGLEDGVEWTGSYELDTELSELVTITIGYPACGYTQENYLFSLKKDRPQLLYNWQSMSDSGWGTYGNIVGKTDNFFFKTISFWPDEEDASSQDMGIVEYSDSIEFKFKNNNWTKEYKSIKDSVYRKRKVSFEKFHDIN